jgi:hypothetical protein
MHRDLVFSVIVALFVSVCIKKITCTQDPGSANLQNEAACS